jgi:hypothetical protein
MHLGWDIHGPLAGVSVDLTVFDPPTVSELYFWALQADFVDEAGTPAGGAHLGLQWHPSYPGSTAVNWGGYHDSGGELEGTDSDLRSAAGNPNTSDYPWRPRRPYRLTIGPARRTGSSTWAWPGTVLDVTDGSETLVRELFVPAGLIGGVVVWSEVFARCDDPTVTVRWSDPTAIRLDGTPATPARASVNYQSHEDGGCANTNSWAAAGGLWQATDTERLTPQGTLLPWP